VPSVFARPHKDVSDADCAAHAAALVRAAALAKATGGGAASETASGSASSSAPDGSSRALVWAGGLAGQVAVELGCLVSPHAALLWPPDAEDDSLKR
jgi:hypothetical protein